MKARKGIAKVKMNAAQKAWCSDYKHYTGFTPLMDDFLAGESTFRDCARHSIRWFEDWSTDAHLAIGRNIPEEP